MVLPLRPHPPPAPPPADVHVVVLGAGVGGVTVASGLDAFCKVTLVDPRDAHFLPFGAVCGLVDPEFGAKLFLPLDKMFKQGVDQPGKFVRGTASSLDSKAHEVGVECADGTKVTLKYTYLVLATGATMSPSFRFASSTDAMAAFKKVSAALASAKKAVIVGGGTCGLETAGEIATKFPEVEVTVVTGGDILAAKSSYGAGKEPSAAWKPAVSKALEQLKVKVVTNARVTLPLPGADKYSTVVGAHTVTTSVGDFRSDCTLVMTGVTARRLPWMPASSLTEDGFVKLEEGTLNVEGLPDVFAIGDCAATLDAKAGYPAKQQAGQVVASIKSLMAGGQRSPYKPMPITMIILTLGPDNGLAHMPWGGVWGTWIVNFLKGDYFLSDTRKTLNLPKA